MEGEMGTEEDRPAGTLKLPEGRITKDCNEKHSKRKLRSKVAVSLHSLCQPGSAMVQSHSIKTLGRPLVHVIKTLNQNKGKYP